jgi:hypothetical protein
MNDLSTGSKCIWLVETRKFIYIGEISGFRDNVFELYDLLACCAAYVGSCLLKFRDLKSVSSSGVKMGPVGFTETSENY